MFSSVYVRTRPASSSTAGLAGVGGGLPLEEYGEGGGFDVDGVGVEGVEDPVAFLGGEEVGAGQRAVRVVGELLDGAPQSGGDAHGVVLAQGVGAVAQPQDRSPVGPGGGDQGERVVGGVPAGDGLDAEPGELLGLRALLVVGPGVDEVVLEHAQRVEQRAAAVGELLDPGERDMVVRQEGGLLMRRCAGPVRRGSRRAGSGRVPEGC